MKRTHKHWTSRREKRAELRFRRAAMRAWGRASPLKRERRIMRAFDRAMIYTSYGALYRGWIPRYQTKRVSARAYLLTGKKT